MMEERKAGAVAGRTGLGAEREVDSQVERRQMGANRKLETSTADCINRSEPPRFSALQHSITTVLTHLIVDHPEGLHGLFSAFLPPCSPSSFAASLHHVRVASQHNVVAMTFSHQVSETAEGFIRDKRQNLCTLVLKRSSTQYRSDTVQHHCVQ